MKDENHSFIHVVICFDKISFSCRFWPFGVSWKDNLFNMYHEEQCFKNENIRDYVHYILSTEREDSDCYFLNELL